MSKPDQEAAPEQQPVAGEISGLTDIENVTENANSFGVNPHEYRFTPLSQQQYSDNSFIYNPAKPVDGAQHPLVMSGLPESQQYFALPPGQTVHMVTSDRNNQQIVYQVSPDFMMPAAAPPTSPGPSRLTHHSLLKVEHRNSRATRRGPMDEMRQLVRILVKLIPASLKYLSVTDEGGGGNRVSEEQIKDYLKHALGEAPQPEWGLPQGWGQYLAELFTWATDRHVTREQAMQCARRLPGRSWEAVEESLQKMGVNPSIWPLPLSKAGVTSAKASDAVPALPAPPSGLKPDGDPENAEHKAKRRKVSKGLPIASPETPGLTELQCWQQARHCLEQACLHKMDTTPPEQMEELQRVKNAVFRLVSTDPTTIRTDAVQHASISTGNPAQANVSHLRNITVQPVYGWRGDQQGGPITGISPLGMPAGQEMLSLAQMPANAEGASISYYPTTTGQPATTVIAAGHVAKTAPVIIHPPGAPNITLPQHFVQHGLPGYTAAPAPAQAPAAAAPPVAPAVEGVLPVEGEQQQYAQGAPEVPAASAPVASDAPPTPPPASGSSPSPTPPRASNVPKDPLVDSLRNSVFSRIETAAHAQPNRLAVKPASADTLAGPGGPPLFQTPGFFAGARAAAVPASSAQAWAAATAYGTGMPAVSYAMPASTVITAAPTVTSATPGVPVEAEPDLSAQQLAVAAPEAAAALPVAVAQYEANGQVPVAEEVATDAPPAVEQAAA